MFCFLGLYIRCSCRFYFQLWFPVTVIVICTNYRSWILKLTYNIKFHISNIDVIRIRITSLSTARYILVSLVVLSNVVQTILINLWILFACRMLLYSLVTQSEEPYNILTINTFFSVEIYLHNFWFTTLSKPFYLLRNLKVPIFMYILYCSFYKIHWEKEQFSDIRPAISSTASLVLLLESRNSKMKL